MKGCRPLETAEIIAFDKALRQFSHPERNRALFYLMLNGALRVTEALHLNIGDVWQNGQLVESVYLKAANTKGGKGSGSFTLNNKTKLALIGHLQTLADLGPNKPLFQSQKGSRLSSRQVIRLFHQVADAAKLSGKIATHTARKTRAKIARDNGADAFDIKKLLRQRSLNSTASYIESLDDKVQGFYLDD